MDNCPDTQTYAPRHHRADAQRRDPVIQVFIGCSAVKFGWPGL